MSLVRFDFNYTQAFVWRAENTEARLVYTEEELYVDQDLLNKDIPRVAVFPKNKYSHDTSKDFFSAWTHVKKPFPYKQGDMDGGSFVQHFWNYVAFMKNNLNLLEKDSNSHLRFGYVSDDGKRCSIVLMYYKNDPSKWMACVTKDTEKDAFNQRHATLFIPKYFSDELKSTLESNQGAQRFSENEAGHQLANILGSNLLAKSFNTFFDAEGKVNIKKIQKFQKSELIKVGYRYVEVPKQKHHFFDTVGATAGWFAAMPTLGILLIFAPLLGVLMAAVVGLFFLCFSKSSNQPVKTTVNTLADIPPEKPSVDGGSHTQMAKCGIQIAPPASPKVEYKENDRDYDVSQLSQGCSSLPASTCKVM